MNKVILVFGTLMLTSCSIFVKEQPPAVEKVVYVTTPIYAPPHSKLPTLNSQELMCLTPAVKQKLLERDQLLHYDRDVYEAIIKSTQK